MRNGTVSLLDRLDHHLFRLAALIGLLSAAAVYLLRNHLPSHNPRIQYAVHHLPLSLVVIGLFALLVGFARRNLDTVSGWSTSACLLAVAGVFGVFWMPTWLAGGFVADDWALLAAASIRRIIYAHPGYSWYALDTVDGNFRPLGTVLYFGYLWKWFGTSPRIFTLGPFLLVLLASLVAFAIVRELGYSRVAATAAALLFLSRGMIYTIVTWASALGDGIAILLCGLTALFILKANRLSAPASIAYHFIAWLAFVFAMLGKQSAFVTPLIVALLIFMRPGESPAGLSAHSLARRAATAAVAFYIYASTSAGIFLHAKSLLHGPSPYPIRLSITSLLQSFSYATWYFVVLQLPERYPLANLLPAVLGLAIVIGILIVVKRFPAILGERPQDVIFACLAAASSLSLFVLLQTRSAPYYGCMAAFWFSIALGIVLTRYGRPDRNNAPARLCVFLFCALLATGFAEVRIEQTGLIPAGGYLWGTFGMDTEKVIYANLRRDLKQIPETQVAVFEDCPGPDPYTAMAVLTSPQTSRILLYDRGNSIYTANDREGLRPVDGFAGLTDLRSYRWTEPLSSGRAAEILRPGKTRSLNCKSYAPQRNSSAKP